MYLVNGIVPFTRQTSDQETDGSNEKIFIKTLAFWFAENENLSQRVFSSKNSYISSFIYLYEKYVIYIPNTSGRHQQYIFSGHPSPNILWKGWLLAKIRWISLECIRFVCIFSVEGREDFSCEEILFYLPLSICANKFASFSS